MKYLSNKSFFNITFAVAYLSTSSLSYALDKVKLNSHVKMFKMQLEDGCVYNNDALEDCWKGPSPLIENGIIYAKGFGEQIYAINQNTGEIVRRYTMPDRDESFSEPIIKDNILYAVGNKLYAFDLLTTKLLWSDGWMTRSTPVISNGVVFVGGRDDLSARDAKTGKLMWLVKSDDWDAHFSKPFIKNGYIYVGTYQSHQNTSFNVYEEKTGKKVESFTGGYDYSSTPCEIDDELYMGNINSFFMMDEIDKNSPPHPHWSYTSNIQGAHFGSPYCDKDRVYVASGYEGKLYSFESKYEKIIWTFEPSSKGMYSTPNVHDDIVFIGSDNHYLYAIDKTTGKLKWKFMADEAIRSKPIIDKGVVYFTTNAGTLYAIDERTGVIN